MKIRFLILSTSMAFAPQLIGNVESIGIILKMER